jgi:hypothetical protein
LAEEKKMHDQYCGLLKEIGKKLGFLMSSDAPREKELYHLANPDCIWYLDVGKSDKDRELIKGIDLPLKMPCVVFEVLFSENEKTMRGSLETFMIRAAYSGVFLLLKRENELDPNYQKRKDYLKNLIDHFGHKRYVIWEKEKVDALAMKLDIPLKGHK